MSSRVDFAWIGEAWSIYRRAWAVWLVLYTAPVLVSFLTMRHTLSSPQVQSILSQVASGNPAYPGYMQAPNLHFLLVEALMRCTDATLSFIALCCGADIALRQVRGEKIEIRSILRGVRRIGSIAVYCLIFAAASVAGALACFVGIFAAFGLMLPGLALTADGCPPITAFSKSVRAMSVDWTGAAWFSLVACLILIGGTVTTYMMGAIILAPLLCIYSALAYRDMLGLPADAHSPYGEGGDTPWEQHGAGDASERLDGVWPPPPLAPSKSPHQPD